YALVRPGQVNLMTAGAGIQHSEVSTVASTTLHGVQLWTALPDRSRHIAPFFEHHEPEPIHVGDATLRVFVGSLAGSTSPISAFTPLLGAQVDLPAGGRVELEVDPTFEHGLLVDAGAPRLDRTTISDDRLAYIPPGP